MDQGKYVLTRFDQNCMINIILCGCITFWDKVCQSECIYYLNILFFVSVSTVSQPLTITTVTPGGNMGSQDLVLTPGGTLSTHGIMAHGGTIGLLPQASLNQPVADAFQQNIETPPAQADPGLFTTPTDSNVGLVTTHLTGETGQHVLSTQQAASQQNIQDLITGTLGEKQNYLIVTGQTLQDRTAQSVHTINQHNQSSQSVQIHLPTGIQNQQPSEQIINQEHSVVKDNDTQPSVVLQSEQNIVEEADVGKTAEVADEATGLASENEKKTAEQPIKVKNVFLGGEKLITKLN